MKLHLFVIFVCLVATTTWANNKKGGGGQEFFSEGPQKEGPRGEWEGEWEMEICFDGGDITPEDSVFGKNTQNFLPEKIDNNELPAELESFLESESAEEDSDTNDTEGKGARSIFDILELQIHRKEFDLNTIRDKVEDQQANGFHKISNEILALRRLKSLKLAKTNSFNKVLKKRKYYQVKSGK